MTKLKSKKMTKSTLAIIIMGIAIVALLAFGGSFAYFTASSSDTGATVTMGNVKLSDNGALASLSTSLTNKMPGDEILAANAITLTVTTTETAGNYVAVKLTLTVRGGDNSTNIALSSLGLDVETALGTAWKQVYKHGASNYTYDFTSDENENTVATGIFVYVADGSTAAKKPAGSLNVNANALTISESTTDNWTENGTYSDSKIMDATLTIGMEAHSIQGSNIEPANSLALLVALFPAS